MAGEPGLIATGARGSGLARWVADAPLATVHQHLPKLRRLEATALDAGAQDQPIAGAIEELASIFSSYRIEHTSEIYDRGNYIRHVDDRVEYHVLPFFSDHLAFP